tara:strand:- start:923 stop:1768 length:846 start_codon:yes stop_codon:yes gene_type:complete
MKSGNIILIGPTNSGKSTLINTIIGKRVTLVSRKKQSTTFNQKLYKYISEYQYILQDTPGFFNSPKKISQKLSSAPLADIDNAVLIYVVIDASRKITSIYKKIFLSLEKQLRDQKVFLILNKTDKIKNEEILNKIKFFENNKVINQIFPISALTGYGTELLLQKSKIYLKNKKNTSSKKTVQIKKEIFYAEVTREKIFDKVHKEIPYYCDIITDKIVNQLKSVKIHQTIIVRKKSHKNIIIGKNGALLKDIGTESRKEISKFENKKIHLFLFVRLVKEKKA